MKRGKVIILLLVLLFVMNLFLIAFMFQGSDENLVKSSRVILGVPEIEQEIVEEDLFAIDYVIDGDSLMLVNGEEVRLICIDTPEKGREGYLDAKEYLEELVFGKMVRLVRDVSDRDKYERLLRYVYLEDGSFVNEMIVKKGYGTVYRYEPDVSLCPVIQSAEDYARRHDLGIWEDSSSNDGGGGNDDNDDDEEEDGQEELDYVCETNYYNCGDFVTHEEAKIVFDYCGGVNNDVHYLDGDFDGIPCEGLL